MCSMLLCSGSPRPPSAGPVAGVPMSGGLLSRRLPSPALQGVPRSQPAPALPSPPLQRVRHLAVNYAGLLSSYTKSRLHGSLALLTC